LRCDLVTHRDVVAIRIGGADTAAEGKSRGADVVRLANGIVVGVAVATGGIIHVLHDLLPTARRNGRQRRLAARARRAVQADSPNAETILFLGGTNAGSAVHDTQAQTGLYIASVGLELQIEPVGAATFASRGVFASLHFDVVVVVIDGLQAVLIWRYAMEPNAPIQPDAFRITTQQQQKGREVLPGPCFLSLPWSSPP